MISQQKKEGTSAKKYEESVGFRPKGGLLTFVSTLAPSPTNRQTFLLLPLWATNHPSLTQTLPRRGGWVPKAPKPESSLADVLTDEPVTGGGWARYKKGSGLKIRGWKPCFVDLGQILDLFRDEAQVNASVRTLKKFRGKEEKI